MGTVVMLHFISDISNLCSHFFFSLSLSPYSGQKFIDFINLCKETPFGFVDFLYWFPVLFSFILALIFITYSVLLTSLLLLLPKVVLVTDFRSFLFSNICIQHYKFPSKHIFTSSHKLWQTAHILI